MTIPFRVAIVGGGRSARERVRSLQAIENVRIVAVADGDGDLAHSLGADLGVPVFDSVPTMLSSREPDGVVVATRQAEQIQNTIEVLQHGIPVICEKPFGCEPSGAAEAIDLAAESKVLLAAGYEAPFMSDGLADLTSPARVGRVYDIDASAIGLDRGPRTPAFRVRDGHAWYGADVLADLLSVVLGVGRDSLRVSAKAWRPGGRAADHLGHETRIRTTVDFANGARATLLVAPRGYAARPRGMRVVVSGCLDEAEIPLLTGYDDCWKQARASAGDAQIRNWINACRGLEDLRWLPELAHRIHQVMAAIYRSIELDGRDVEIDWA